MTTKFKTLRAAVCVAAVSLSTTAIYAQNLLVDPGFESQTAPASGGWNVFNGAGFSSAFARTGVESMLDSGPGNFGVPGSFETFNAVAGQAYELTGFGFTPTTLTDAADSGVLQITFFSGANGSGNNLGTINISAGGIATGANNAQTSGSINSTSAAGQWIMLDTGIAQAPAGAMSLQAFTLVLDSGPTAVYFDDLTLTQVSVPEPGTFALLGLSLLGIPAFAWRRKK
jgi:hypothetical protein